MLVHDHAGPEAGTQFWSGQRPAAGGYATPPFNYASWAPNEPNNAGGAEDYAVTNWRGTVGFWNDLSNSPSPAASGYLVEYSGSFTGTSSTTLNAEVLASTPLVPQYTLTYDANGGSCTAPPSTGPSTSWVSTPGSAACTRAGYTFTGWNTSANGSGIGFAPGGSTQLTGDNTLYAQWTPVGPTVIAVADVNATGVDTPASGSLATNDTVPAGSTYSLATGPSDGTVVVKTDGTYTYTPSPGFVGTDSFTYRVCAPGAGGGLTPQAGNGGSGGDGGAGGRGGDGGPNSSAGNGGGDSSAGGAGGAGGRRGARAGTVGVSSCATATVTITVAGPSPKRITPIVTPPGKEISGNVAEPGTTPPGAIYSVVTEPGHGTVDMKPNGSYTYVPDAGFVGTDSFRYQVCIPGGSACPQFVVPITVGRGKPASGSTASGVCADDGTRIAVGFSLLSSVLSRASRTELDRLRLSGCRVVVTGHVQPVGATSNDLSLSQARAASVAAHLRSGGVATDLAVTAARRTMAPACVRFENRCVVVSVRRP